MIKFIHSSSLQNQVKQINMHKDIVRFFEKFTAMWIGTCPSVIIPGMHIKNKNIEIAKGLGSAG